jgi:hypothetical protein
MRLNRAFFIVLTTAFLSMPSLCQSAKNQALPDLGGTWILDTARSTFDFQEGLGTRDYSDKENLDIDRHF